MNFRPYESKGLDSVNKIQAGWTDAVHTSPHSLVGACAPQGAQVIIQPPLGSLRPLWCPSVLTRIALGLSPHVPRLPAALWLVCLDSLTVICYPLAVPAPLHGMAEALLQNPHL